MLNTPALSTSSVACGWVVRTPILLPDWNTIEFPNVLPLVQIGMKCVAPCPETADVVAPLLGTGLVVFVDVWAEAAATESMYRIQTARILDFMTFSPIFSKSIPGWRLAGSGIALSSLVKRSEIAKAHSGLVWCEPAQGSSARRLLQLTPP
jgi:hypothetical protein